MGDRRVAEWVAHHYVGKYRRSGGPGHRDGGGREEDAPGEGEHRLREPAPGVRRQGARGLSDHRFLRHCWRGHAGDALQDGWWCDRAHSGCSCQEVQLREDDLP